MKAVDRQLVIRAAEVITERIRRLKQPHPETLAAAVRLEDERTAVEVLPSRFDQQFLACDEHGHGRADAGSFEGSVLAHLADLEVESVTAVDDAAAMTLEPSQHRGGQLGGIAVVAGVRR